MKFPYLIIAIALLFCACSKDKDDKIPENSLTARFDGVDFTFDKSKVVYQTNQVYHQLYITGRATGTYGEISIVVNANKEITPGKYKYDPSADLIDANVSFADSYSSGAQGLWGSLFFSSPNPMTVTITSLRDSTVKGHFTGELRLSASEATGKTISGEFSLPYTRLP